MQRLERLFSGFRQNGLQGKDYLERNLKEGDPIRIILTTILEEEIPHIPDLQDSMDSYFSIGFATGMDKAAMKLHRHAMNVLPPERYGQYARVLYWGGRSMHRSDWYPSILDDLYKAVEHDDQCRDSLISTLTDSEIPIIHDPAERRLRVSHFLFGDEHTIPEVYSNPEADNGIAGNADHVD